MHPIRNMWFSVFGVRNIGALAALCYGSPCRLSQWLRSNIRLVIKEVESTCISRTCIEVLKTREGGSWATACVAHACLATWGWRSSIFTPYFNDAKLDSICIYHNNGASGYFNNGNLVVTHCMSDFDMLSFATDKFTNFEKRKLIV